MTAAIRLFGQSGFDAVSTRQLAAAARVNVASIKYHFGSKEALYVAALDHMVGIMAPRVQMLCVMIGDGIKLAGADPGRQALLVRRFIEAALQVFLGRAEVRTFMPLALRELFGPGPHFDRLYGAVSGRLHAAVTGLVAYVTGASASAPATIIRAHAIIGQIIVFQIGRAILARRLGQDDAPMDIELISSTVGDMVLSSLDLPLGSAA
jgi:AcrR family transcriptional regulator